MKPPITWKAAVLAALERFSKRHRSLQIDRGVFLGEELPAMTSATNSAGRTPAQTVSRVLQELRDEGRLFFSQSGVYVLSGRAIDTAYEDFPEDVLDHAAESGTLQVGDVAAFDAVGQTRVRHGMAAVRRRTLHNYRGRCALCDIDDTRLLVASHIARWADCPDARGRLTNIICLCRVHDPLFEFGYFSLTDELAMRWQPIIRSEAVRKLSEVCTGRFRVPIAHRPAAAYLQAHRERVGLLPL
jgi:hypothetical protein